jgi:hypothetical protein
MQSLNRASSHRSPAKNLQSQQAGGQSPARRPNKGKEKAKDAPKFPGFVNSFLSNTPQKRLASSQRGFEPLVEGAFAPLPENITSSPFSSPTKFVAQPPSSRPLSRPQASRQPTEPLDTPAHQEATIDIEMELPDMETEMDMDGFVEEPADPEDFLSFEPLSLQDEVSTQNKKVMLAC